MGNSLEKVHLIDKDADETPKKKLDEAIDQMQKNVEEYEEIEIKTFPGHYIDPRPISKHVKKRRCKLYAICGGVALTIVVIVVVIVLCVCLI